MFVQKRDTNYITLRSKARNWIPNKIMSALFVKI